MSDTTKTHLVFDITLTEEEGRDCAVFSGTYQECIDFQSEQGFGYQVSPMTPQEYLTYNS